MPADDKLETKNLILDSAENFFISLKKNTYRTVWELLSARSQENIISDVLKESEKIGVQVNRKDVENDFSASGTISANYWRSFLQNFNPDIVLNERLWEFESIERDNAVILLKGNNVVTKLKMYRENSLWKVGLVETFWKSRAYGIIEYLTSVLVY
ncbi:MAG: hypothetical protein HY758_00495 [Nitrospirae bacterium]|nr:hypothetical protein [Nitrospirota bacterium]